MSTKAARRSVRAPRRRLGCDDRVHVASYDGSATRALPPVIRPHDFAANSQFDPLAPGIVDELLARGLRVIAVDARGQGESEAPRDVSARGESRVARDLRERAYASHLDVFARFGPSSAVRRHRRALPLPVKTRPSDILPENLDLR